MYRNTDIVKIFAIGLAIAVLTVLPARERTSEAVKGCLLFPQFAEAAAADRTTASDDGGIEYAFGIAELWERLFGSV